MAVYFITNIKHCYYIYCVCYILLTILLFSFIVLKIWSDLVFDRFLSLIKITVFVHASAWRWDIYCRTIDLSYIQRLPIGLNMISRSKVRYNRQVIILSPPSDYCGIECNSSHKWGDSQIILFFSLKHD